jgi:aldehyde oxidoreductase
MMWASAINPLLVEGQVAGRCSRRGIGMALMEDYIVPGRTENLHDYLIPTFGDIPPRSKSLIVEVPDAHGPYRREGPWASMC